MANFPTKIHGWKITQAKKSISENFSMTNSPKQKVFWWEKNLLLKNISFGVFSILSKFRIGMVYGMPSTFQITKLALYHKQKSGSIKANCWLKLICLSLLFHKIPHIDLLQNALI
jgi:hypothetical protein